MQPAKLTVYRGACACTALVPQGAGPDACCKVRSVRKPAQRALRDEHTIIAGVKTWRLASASRIVMET